MEIKQQLKLSQQLVMTPQLQQAIRLLQLSRLELIDEIRKELDANPVLADEEIDPRARSKSDEMTGNASADVVASESLLENAMPAAQVLGEAARVLRPGGWLRLTTANRWSLGPDPHVGLPMGGWLPASLVHAWATRRGMVPPRRHLLSAADLRGLLTPPRFERPRIGPPPVTDAQRAGASSLVRAGVDAYRVAARLSVGRAALTAIGPTLLAVARRTASA